jgi:hypothetical protein
MESQEMGEQSLKTAVTEFVEHSNKERAHQELDNQMINSRIVECLHLEKCIETVGLVENLITIIGKQSDF